MTIRHTLDHRQKTKRQDVGTSTQHALRPAEGGSCQLRPEPQSVIPGLDLAIIQPLVLLDLGTLDPALAGRTVPCFAYLINEQLTFAEQSDGTWTLVSNYEHTLKWAEPISGGAEAFDALPRIEAAELVDAGSEGAVAGLTLQMGEPRWVQYDDAPGGDYRFVAQMESRYFFGTIYVFYDAAQRRAAYICQFS